MVESLAQVNGVHKNIIFEVNIGQKTLSGGQEYFPHESFTFTDTGSDFSPTTMKLDGIQIGDFDQDGISPPIAVTSASTNNNKIKARDAFQLEIYPQIYQQLFNNPEISNILTSDIPYSISAYGDTIEIEQVDNDSLRFTSTYNDLSYSLQIDYDLSGATAICQSATFTFEDFDIETRTPNLIEDLDIQISFNERNEDTQALFESLDGLANNLQTPEANEDPDAEVTLRD